MQIYDNFTEYNYNRGNNKTVTIALDTFIAQKRQTRSITMDSGSNFKALAQKDTDQDDKEAVRNQISNFWGHHHFWKL